MANTLQVSLGQHSERGRKALNQDCHGAWTARMCCSVMAYLPGQTPAQWQREHRTPDLAMVRDIVSQLARGLQAFHRKEMLHQDLRPENIMMDPQDTVTIIDFGSTRVTPWAPPQDMITCRLHS